GRRWGGRGARPGARATRRPRRLSPRPTSWPNSAVQRPETKARARALQLLYAWELSGRPSIPTLVSRLAGGFGHMPAGFDRGADLAAKANAGLPEVDLVASGWPGGAREAVLDGMRVRRFGGRHSFALHARGAVRSLLRAHAYDIVVEDINKLPLYLTQLTDLPFCVIVPHLFGTTAFAEASWPIAATVWAAERLIPRVYRRAAFHAISDSTRDDLVRRGVRRDPVEVIYPGVDAAWYSPDAAVPRAATPTFLYVGRLKRYKGVETAVRAVALARAARPDVTLEIAGQGDDRVRLERLAGELGQGDAVRFFGFVSEEAKRRL